MTNIVAKAASYIDQDGYGSMPGKWYPWNSELQTAAPVPNPEKLSWPSILPVSCPRFGRMDAICKASIIAVELFRDYFNKYDTASDKNTGVGIEISTGSLGSDIKFIQTGSPSVFVYTLPSTAIGEICIRYGFTGPAICFISNTHGLHVLRTCSRWIISGEAQAAVCITCNSIDNRSARAAGYSLPDTNGDKWETGALYMDSNCDENNGGYAVNIEKKDISLLSICRGMVCFNKNISYNKD